MASLPVKAAATAAPPMPAGLDPAYYSLSLLRRRKLDECVAVSTYHLNQGVRGGARDGGAASAGPAGGLDEQLWCIQTKAIILQSWFDDTEIEDDGVDDVLLEGEQAVVSTAHRPNTSLRAARQGTSRGMTAAGGSSAAGAPASRGAGLGTSGGRPVSSRYGFARPGTLNNRPGTLSGGRAGTAVRPVTGRFVRIGTASLMAVPGGPHINVQRLNLERYAREKPMVAKLLCDYLLYVEHRPKLALELCTAALRPPPSLQSPLQSGPGLPAVPGSPRSANNSSSGGGGGGPNPSGTVGLPPMRSAAAAPAPASSSPPALRYTAQVGIPSGQDWWWKERLGKANYQLGLLREAEKNFKASLFDRPPSAVVFGGPVAAGGRFVNYQAGTVMELGKVYCKMDQPLTALELYTDALEANPVDHNIVLCCARLQDELRQTEKAFDYYTQVLRLDSSNVEAIACIAAHFFYERNQPELAMRFYRRLLEMGVRTAECWNNLGLCAFYSSQLDFALSCLERALALCREDAQRADLWYNIGHIGIGLGDKQLAKRAFMLAVATDRTHAEALTNLGVLALEESPGSKEGRRRVDAAVAAAPALVEALFNAAVLAYEAGELEQANTLLLKALDAFPDHPESVALQAKLREQFLAL